MYLATPSRARTTATASPAGASELCHDGLEPARQGVAAHRAHKATASAAVARITCARAELWSSLGILNVCISRLAGAHATHDTGSSEAPHYAVIDAAPRGGTLASGGSSRALDDRAGKGLAAGAAATAGQPWPRETLTLSMWYRCGSGLTSPSGAVDGHVSPV